MENCACEVLRYCTHKEETSPKGVGQSPFPQGPRWWDVQKGEGTGMHRPVRAASQAPSTWKHHCQHTGLASQGKAEREEENASIWINRFINDEQKCECLFL